MISVQEAQQLVTGNTFVRGPEEIPVRDIQNRVLCEDIFSPLDLPPFDQSAMDGYAVRFNGDSSSFKVIGEVAAGSVFAGELEKGSAVRIFTGAKVPGGADAVIMQEKVRADGKNIIADPEVLKKGANIRPAGSEIKKAVLAIKKDKLLNPAAAGFIASMGITSVKVYSRPRVSILATGNELVSPGESLGPGKIFESNSAALHSALKLSGLDPVNFLHAEDYKEKIRAALSFVADQSDIVLITGGISVGDYDFAGVALKELGVETVFYKVKQKPGKPLF